MEAPAGRRAPDDRRSSFRLSLSPAVDSRAAQHRHSAGVSPREQWALSIQERAHAVSIADRPRAVSLPAYGGQQAAESQEAAPRRRSDMTAHSMAADLMEGEVDATDEPPLLVSSPVSQFARCVEQSRFSSVSPSAAAVGRGGNCHEAQARCSEEVTKEEKAQSRSLMDADHVRGALVDLFDRQAAMIEELLQGTLRGILGEFAENVAQQVLHEIVEDAQAKDEEAADDDDEPLGSDSPPRVHHSEAAEAFGKTCSFREHPAWTSVEDVEPEDVMTHAVRAERRGGDAQSPVRTTIAGSYTDSDNRSFHVTQQGHHVTIFLPGRRITGSLHGRTLNVDGWPPGDVLFNGDVEFPDGSWWKRISTPMSVGANEHGILSEHHSMGSTSASSDCPPDLLDRVGVFAFARKATGSKDALSQHAKAVISLFRRGSMEETWWTRTADKIEERVLQMASMEEPSRHRLVDRIVRSLVFEVLTIFVILANICLVWFTTNYEVAERSVFKAEWIALLEWCFVAFYSVEIALRFASSGVYFFLGQRRSWNMFDSLLLGLAIFGMVAEETMRDWTYLRTLRALRLARVIRAIHLLHALGLEDLMLMLSCVLGSFSQLFWSICLICFIYFLFGIFFVQMLAWTLINHGGSLTVEQEEDIAYNFGSVGTAVLTLVTSTTGGQDWVVVYEILSHAGVQAQLLFIFFILFNFLSLWNVITSTFVEKALKLGRPTPNHLAMEAQREERTHALELRQLFKRADADSSGKISLEEFRRFCEVPEFVAFLRMRGVDIKEADTFYHLLVDAVRGEGHDCHEIHIDQIVAICLRVKGHATSVDLHTVRYELQQVKHTQHDVMRWVKRLLRSMRVSTHQRERRRSSLGLGSRESSLGSLPLSPTREGFGARGTAQSCP